MSITKACFYHVKAEQLAAYREISQILDRFLKTCQGFMGRTVKQDHQDSTLFVDLIEWESLEASESAEKAMRTAAELKACSAALDKIVSFHTLHSYSSTP